MKRRLEARRAARAKKMAESGVTEKAGIEKLTAVDDVVAMGAVEVPTEMEGVVTDRRQEAREDFKKRRTAILADMKLSEQDKQVRLVKLSKEEEIMEKLFDSEAGALFAMFVSTHQDDLEEEEAQIEKAKEFIEQQENVVDFWIFVHF